MSEFRSSTESVLFDKKIFSGISEYVSPTALTLVCRVLKDVVRSAGIFYLSKHASSKYLVDGEYRTMVENCIDDPSRQLRLSLETSCGSWYFRVKLLQPVCVFAVDILLDLTGKWSESLTDILNIFPSVERLGIQSTSNRKIPSSALSICQKLKVVDLKNCEIDGSPGSLCLPELEEIFFSSASAFESEVFSLSFAVKQISLSNISLSEPCFASLCTTFPQLQSLKLEKITLNSDKSETETEIEGFANLTRLDCPPFILKFVPSSTPIRELRLNSDVSEGKEAVEALVFELLRFPLITAISFVSICVDDLPRFRHVRNLQKIGCVHGLYRNANVAVLAEFTELSDVSFYGPWPSLQVDFTPLTGLPNLRSIDLKQFIGQIDLAVLRECKSLEVIHIRRSSVRDNDEVSDWKVIHWLDEADEMSITPADLLTPYKF